METLSLASSTWNSVLSLDVHLVRLSDGLLFRIAWSLILMSVITSYTFRSHYFTCGHQDFSQLNEARFILSDADDVALRRDAEVPCRSDFE